MTPNPLSNVTFDASRRETPAREKAVKGQVRSDQGGYVFKVGIMERARRFLILGSDSTFYRTGASLSLENAEVIKKIAQSEKVFELIDLIVEISEAGRAPSQSPGLFALAVVVTQTEDPEARNHAYEQLSRVARTGSTLFEFLGYYAQFKNLGGTGLKKALGRWYMDKDVNKLAYQMVKYRQRKVSPAAGNSMDHARTLRLSKYVKSNDRPELNGLLDWALDKPVYNREDVPRVVQGFEFAKRPGANLPVLIREYGLSWEMIPTEALNDVKVWDALLDGNVPLGALIRQLPRLTRLGMLPELGGRTAEIEDRLTNSEALRKARIHPIKALSSMRVYGRGYGKSSSWNPNRRIVGALEQSFYNSFETVEPTGKRLYLGIDVSRSMDGPPISDDIPLVPLEIAGVMAMVVARTEREHCFGAFQNTIVPLNITARDSIETVIQELHRFPHAGTNLSLPMIDAMQRGMNVDAFVLYTDNELGLGHVHPFQALQRYRDASRIDSKIIVNAVTATKFSMADPSDRLALDIAGFDASAPALIAEFIR